MASKSEEEIQSQDKEEEEEAIEQAKDKEKIDQVEQPSEQSASRQSTQAHHAAQTKAGATIWRAWMSYRMKKQYRYFRDLISDVKYLNPYETLKIINPNEAKLVDRASGTVIRFRLGGEYFPPNVYYKIATSRPVIDMCAMSPRDYAAHPAVWSLDTHNKPSKKPLPQDKDDWYKRIENNGWRLVTESNFQLPASQDPITIQTAQQPKQFHYSKVVRQKDLDQKRKEQKISWMMKMYKAGKEKEEKEKRTFMENEDGADSSAADVSKKESLKETDEEYDVVPEDEVEKLIEWSQQASFDQYLDDWSHLACVTFTESLETSETF